MVAYSQPESFLQASKTTALFNNKVDIFGFALIPAGQGPCLARL